MKRMEILRTSGGLLVDSAVAARAATGTHCPFTGWWGTSDQTTGTVVVYAWKGSLMPGQAGRPVEWRLAKADPAGEIISDMPDPNVMVNLLQQIDLSL